MKLSISIPYIVTLPNIKVYLSNNFYSVVTNGADILHMHPTFELVCIDEQDGMKFVITPPLVEHVSFNSVQGNICSLLFSVSESDPNAMCNAFLKLTHQTEIKDSFDGAKRIENIKHASYDAEPGASELIAAELNLLFVNLARGLGLVQFTPYKCHQTMEEKYVSLLDYYFNVQLNDPLFRKTQLAQSLNVSERQLTRILDRVYHSSFSVILTQHRLNLANTLLGQGEMSIEEVAYAVGYNSAYSFRRAYRNFFGRRPVRKKQNRT